MSVCILLLEFVEARFATIIISAPVYVTYAGRLIYVAPENNDDDTDDDGPCKYNIT